MKNFQKLGIALVLVTSCRLSNYEFTLMRMDGGAPGPDTQQMPETSVQPDMGVDAPPQDHIEPVDSPMIRPDAPMTMGSTCDRIMQADCLDSTGMRAGPWMELRNCPGSMMGMGPPCNSGVGGQMLSYEVGIAPTGEPDAQWPALRAGIGNTIAKPLSGSQSATMVARFSVQLSDPNKDMTLMEAVVGNAGCGIVLRGNQLVLIVYRERTSTELGSTMIPLGMSIEASLGITRFANLPVMSDECGAIINGARFPNNPTLGRYPSGMTPVGFRMGLFGRTNTMPARVAYEYAYIRNTPL